MNHKTLQLITAAPGIPMLLNGVCFVLDPGQVAMSLGMPLLEGLGRSTQIGDIGAFFLTCAWCVFYGSYRSSSSWLGAGALLLGLAAVMRLLAFGLHDAAFAPVFIAVEVVLATWLTVCAVQFERRGREATQHD